MSPADTPHWRPAWHFTPAAQWMNDPNGLVCHDGVYHLFFQYHPHSAVWGPMHWGHATSRDLLHWQEQPLALAPGPLGMAFSGSIVVDADHRSGLGPPGSTPMVAMYTLHDMDADRAGGITHETQGLAVSLDGGQRFTPYAGNPVLLNPGLRDIRDPKLRWLPERERWLCVLACGDHVRFYSSPDLRHWTMESGWGAGLGAHGGVWECPDLFPLTAPDGTRLWVLLVSLNPGGPHDGSATQYFLGDFDGQRFMPQDTRVRWLDHGPDNYAGITWAGVEDRALFIGWMSNWRYASALPTAPWRSAMTMPRELSLRRAADGWRLASAPAREWQALRQPAAPSTVRVCGEHDLTPALAGCDDGFVLELTSAQRGSVTLLLGNALGESLCLGYDAPTDRWWIDRRAAGPADFHPAFAAQHSAPRWSAAEGVQLSAWFDRGSVELFADAGLTTMTSLHFPRAPWSSAQLLAGDLTLQTLSLQALRRP